MAAATGNFAELLWPGIKEIFGNKYNDWKPIFEQIFDVKKSDQSHEKEQGVTGLPLAGIKEQGGGVTFVDPMQGYQKEYVNVTYALGASVTREMYEDDQYNYINALPAMLARSMRQTEEIDHANVLNNAFDATYTGADGLELCSTVHTLVGGGTYSNELATPADLTETSLEQACIDIMDLVDDQALQIMVRPKKLIVATAEKFQAKKILGTTLTLGSDNNDINVVRDEIDGTPCVNPYLTDPDAWFIKTDVENGLRSYQRRAAEIERDNEFETQNLRFITTKRWSRDWTDPRGVFGTAGAG